MKGPPPYLVRRLVIAPAFVVGSVAALAALPLWVIAAAFASRFVPGRWRILRVAWFLFVYLALEAVMLVVLFGVWIGSGFGWKIRSPGFVELHYRLAAWWLRRVMGTVRRTFDVTITTEHDVAPRPGRPTLVFCRHAGPGDSFLLVDALLNRYDRMPRIILKDLLQLDPCVDVALNRVPSRFVPSSGPGRHAVVESIAELAAGLGGDGTLVLFPEGANFTPRRRRRAIEKLDEMGRPGLADRARAMQHVLPPRAAGALAALAAAPDADVRFVGHVGLERLTSMRDLWRGIPMDSEVVARVWAVDAADVPPPDQRELWLFDHWAEIDAWISEHLDVAAAGTAGDLDPDDLAAG